MATFYNQATLSYNGNTTTSNITTGELVEVLSATKTAVQTEYQQDDTLTYVVNILNSGNTTMTGVTISDNLGAYTLNTITLVPMDYVVGTVRYYVGGVLQPTPTVTAGPPLTISGLSVPAKGNVTVIYQAKTNDYAPLAQESSITNTATINANNIANPITASATVNAYSKPVLRISKSLTPTTVSENGQLTYTFIIQNYGNTAADEADALIVSDRFESDHGRLQWHCLDGRYRVHLRCHHRTVCIDRRHHHRTCRFLYTGCCDRCHLHCSGFRNPDHHRNSLSFPNFSMK